MKTLIFTTLLSLLVSSCVTYDWVINDNIKYSHYIGKEAVISSKLYLYRKPIGDEKFSKYTLWGSWVDYSAAKDEDDSYQYKLIEEVLPGRVITITEARREKGGDGHVWDQLIGQIDLKSTNKTLKFVYLVGLSNENKELPFDLIK